MSEVQTPPAPSPYQSASTPPTGPRWLGIVSLVLGILAIVLVLLPWVGLVLGLAAVVFGVIGLVRKSSKGMSITGTVLGALGAIGSVLVSLLLTAILGALLAVTPNLVPPSADPDPAPAPSQSVEGEPTEGGLSGLIDEIIAEVNFDTDFVAMDADTFAAFIADPIAYEGQLFVITGNRGEPLVSDWAEENQLCMMAFTAMPADSAGDAAGQQSIAYGDGTMYECELLDTFIQPSAEGLATPHTMWVMAAATAPLELTAESVEAPVFIVLKVE